MAQRIEPLWDRLTWREIAADLCHTFFDGSYEPTEGQVKSAHRDYDKLTARYGNAPNQGAGAWAETRKPLHPDHRRKAVASQAQIVLTMT